MFFLTNYVLDGLLWVVIYLYMYKGLFVCKYFENVALHYSNK